MLLNYWTVLKLAFALLPIVESVQEVDVQPLRKFYSPKPLANREDGSISKVTLTQKGYIQVITLITEYINKKKGKEALQTLAILSLFVRRF